MTKAHLESARDSASAAAAVPATACVSASAPASGTARVSASAAAPATVRRLRASSPYEGYAYAYPHKTAYRPLAQPTTLEEAWRDEPKANLFLYVHVPFCEMRCGFCNLFTHALPTASLEEAYVRALALQAKAVKRALSSEHRFVRVALGGGTPTFLDTKHFVGVLDVVEREFGTSLSRTPAALETSPRTATEEKLREAAARGVSRISIGVQSFFDAELTTLARPSHAVHAREALARIRRHSFEVLNIDLIYGIPGQTTASWLASLETALQYEPEELFLYPLYVRPLTGLGRREERAGAADDGASLRGGRHELHILRETDPRPELYRAAVDLLSDRGYRQTSMRMFERRAVAHEGGAHPPAAVRRATISGAATSATRAPDATTPGTAVPATQAPGPLPYACQRDGMIGLGPGARSYTKRLHYSDDWAVSRAGVREVLESWIERQSTRPQAVWHGYRLNDEEARRRYIIQSLLQVSGLDRDDYRRTFSTDALEDFAGLRDLEGEGLATIRPDRISLTADGLSYSDAIGPWLYSARVRALMEDYDLR